MRTRFVTTRNSVGFIRKKAQTISFVERGFEKARPQSPDGGFFMVFIHDQVVFALGDFLLEASWEALVFGHFSQPVVLIVPFSFYTSLCFFILRPRVGSTFQD